MLGRPKKNRKKDHTKEEGSSQGILSRVGLEMTCQYCMQTRHNRRGCPNLDKPPTERPPKNNKGRQRKNPIKVKPSTRSVPSGGSVPIETCHKARSGYGVMISDNSGFVYMLRERVVEVVYGPSATTKRILPAPSKENYIIFGYFGYETFIGKVYGL
ncbi:hypothetical protein GH714_005338 [Hevea brasiliensis]|uniref:Uncharacterized protein n=1 Tax=Hevea brasiliensis TaxID=3981 RepID=A0A6A6KS43_HEVBR|nr:hypothetical protein GH714_005338 [Hevea brasiliensis]